MGEQRSDRRAAEFGDEARPRSLEEIRTHQLREDPGHEAAGQIGRPAEGVLVQVCQVCGKEYTFDDHQPPADL